MLIMLPCVNRRLSGSIKCVPNEMKQHVSKPLKMSPQPAKMGREIFLISALKQPVCVPQLVKYLTLWKKLLADIGLKSNLFQEPTDQL